MTSLHQDSIEKYLTYKNYMCVYKAPRFSIESKGFTEDQDKEKDKDSQDH